MIRLEWKGQVFSLHHIMIPTMPTQKRIQSPYLSILLDDGCPFPHLLAARLVSSSSVSLRGMTSAFLVLKEIALTLSAWILLRGGSTVSFFSLTWLSRFFRARRDLLPDLPTPLSRLSTDTLPSGTTHQPITSKPVATTASWCRKNGNVKA